MTIPHNVVLASRSSARADILSNAGVTFVVDPSDIDEDKLRSDMAGQAHDKLAQFLSDAKAVSVSSRWSDICVIGADQVLSFDGHILSKPKDISTARQYLRLLRGGTHVLYSAVTCVRGDNFLWRHVGIASLTMRSFSDDFLDHYLEETEDLVCSSVGGYRLEDMGAQLFDKIEGDYFTILGLPLLPLLSFLRSETFLLS